MVRFGGAHVLETFTRAGLPTVALDSLVSGHRDFVPASIPFIHASIPAVAHLPSDPTRLVEHLRWAPLRPPVPPVTPTRRNVTFRLLPGLVPSSARRLFLCENGQARDKRPGNGEICQTEPFASEYASNRAGLTCSSSAAASTCV